MRSSREELRLLNLALVDIGAGTSDIAISDEGCISAYDMATVAGDEITEAIAKEFLLDFYTAERIKYESMTSKRSDIKISSVLNTRLRPKSQNRNQAGR